MALGQFSPSGSGGWDDHRVKALPPREPKPRKTYPSTTGPGLVNAIETSYDGHLFRSRLEAKWAVFFNRLGIEYRYEPQSYRVGPAQSSRGYLPDFWLPGSGVWAEVKGLLNRHDAETLILSSGQGSGLPGNGILLLGDLPRSEPGWMIWQSLITREMEPRVRGFVFVPGGIGRVGDQALGAFALDPDEGSNCWRFEAEVDDEWGNRPGAIGTEVAEAYRAARSARFEHGQSGGML